MDSESNIEKTGADSRNQPKVSIVELTPDDWTIFRDLKLGSLDQEPIAFVDVDVVKQKWLERTEAEWRSILSGRMSDGRLGESLNVFAKDQTNDKYMGMVSGIIPEGSKTATVQHMYVDNEDRGKGIGKQLLQALIDRIRARETINQIELQVVVTQQAAIGLYKSLGFKEVRKIEKAVKRGDQEYDEFEMLLDLK